MSLLGIFSIFSTIGQIFKESTAPTIPAENWANKELIHQDRMRGISDKEFSRNLANGKYKLTQTYPEPHRDERGRIIIENYALYKEDVHKYGAAKAHEWMRQGKYNLTPEEVAKEKERFQKDMERLYKLL